MQYGTSSVENILHKMCLDARISSSLNGIDALSFLFDHASNCGILSVLMEIIKLSVMPRQKIIMLDGHRVVVTLAMETKLYMMI